MKKYLFCIYLTIFLSISNGQAEEVQQSRIHQITDNVYNIINLDYSNIGVVIGKNSVALIESGMGDYEEHSNDNVLKLIRTITDKPIKYVINLHSHPDHSGGNKFESISFFNELFVFKKGSVSDEVQLQVNFPEKAPYLKKVSGIWVK